MSTNKFWSSLEYVIEVKIPGFTGRINKRYNDFLAFNEALLTKFKNLEFPDFPSKFQLVNKKETRKDKFSYLFHLIMHYAKTYPELKDRFLGMLYTFLVAQWKTISIHSPEKEESDIFKNRTITSKRTRLMNMLKKGFVKENGQKIKRRNSHDLSNSQNNLTDENFPHLFSDKKLRKMDLDDSDLVNRRLSDIKTIKKIDSIVMNASPQQLEMEGLDVIRADTQKEQQDLFEKAEDKFHSVLRKNGIENIGYVWAKFPHPDKWKKYYLKWDGPILYFYKSVKDNDFKVWYTIYKWNIECLHQKINEEEDETEVFVISQKYDTRCILLAITEYKDRVKDYLRNLQDRARIAPLNMMEFNETIRYPMGILYLHINKILGIEVPVNTFIRITLEPYKIETRHVNRSKNGEEEFHQRFYLPIHNHFNELVMDIVLIENEGWFREKRKEQLIGSVGLPLSNLHSMIVKENSNKLLLPIKLQNKKILADILKGKYNKISERVSEIGKDDKSKENIVDEADLEVERYLEIEIYNFTSINSLYAFHLNRNRVENRVLEESYSLKKYQEVIWRLKLCSLAFEKFKNAQRFIFYHNYPKFSLFCEIFMILFVYFFNSEQLMSYAISSLIMVLIINSGFMSEHINWFFFLHHHRNKDIKDTQIKSQMFIDEELTKTKLKEEKEKIDEKSSFYNIKKRGILGRYNQFKQKSAKTLDKLEYVVDMFEKFKNLLLWKDELMTKYFLVILLILYAFLTFMPLRYITILYLIRRFHKGKSYYKRRKKSNEIISKIEIAKFMIMEVDELYMVKEWPKKTKNFESKLISHFQTFLKIYLPAKITETYKSPHELAEHVSDADAVLRLIENDENDIYLEQDVSRVIMRVRKPAYKYVLNFLMNYVPSDLYQELMKDKYQ